MVARLRKRGGMYWADLHVGGKRVRQSLKTANKEAATEKLAALELRLMRRDDGVVDNAEGLELILRQWLALKESTVRPSTARRYRQHVTNLLRCLPRGLRVDQLSQATIADFRRRRRTEPANPAAAKKAKATQPHRAVSPQSIAKDEVALNCALNWAAGESLINRNPIANMKPPEFHPRERRALEPDEVGALLGAATEPYRNAFEFLTLTGLRKDELCGLKFSDINARRNVIVIAGAVAKGKRRREVPIGSRVAQIIEQQRKSVAHRQPGNRGGRTAIKRVAATFSRDHVFTTAAGSPLGHNLTREFLAACRRAGIELSNAGGKIDLHSLRTTCATSLLRAGVPPRTVQTWLGHASLQTTMKCYGRVHESDMRAAADAVSYPKPQPKLRISG